MCLVQCLLVAAHAPVQSGICSNMSTPFLGVTLIWHGACSQASTQPTDMCCNGNLCSNALVLVSPCHAQNLCKEDFSL